MLQYPQNIGMPQDLTVEISMWHETVQSSVNALTSYSRHVAPQPTVDFVENYARVKRHHLHSYIYRVRERVCVRPVYALHLGCTQQWNVID